MNEEAYTGYKHDVFISYAHIDNEPAPGVDEGWVSIFVKALKTRLKQRLGKSISVWCDPQLPGSGEIKPAILNIVRDSAILIIILSPAYINSEWCNFEKDAFLEDVKKRDTFTRVFIVERDKLEEKEKPKEFQNLISHYFWVEEQEGEAPRILGDPEPDPKNPKDILYYQRLNDLAFKLSEELKNLKSLTKGKLPINLKYDASPTVFLAEEATNDPEDLREKVRQYLDQKGIRVLPEETSLYPSYLQDAASVEQRLIKELENCQVFVQLLRNLPGDHPLWQLSFPRFQYEIARKLSKPILQWRDPKLDLDIVTDNDQRILLEGASIMKLDDFKFEIITRLKQKEGLTTSFDVFLSHNSKNKPTVRQLAKKLQARGLKVWLDEEQLVPGRSWQEALEKIILTTRTAAVLVGKDGLGPWETPEMQACLSQFVRRHLPVIPVLLPDVPTEPELPLFLQNLTWVDLRGGLTEDGLKKLEWGITGVKPETSSGSAENKLPSMKPDHRKLVFVNVGLEDKSLGENISKALSKNAPCFLPLLEAKPSDFRQDWEQLLTSCDGLITVYGEVKNMWVRGQLLEYRKIKREQPLETQAIYEGPPEGKEPLNVTLPPDVMIMDCRKGLNENELQRFLNALGVGHE